MDQQLFRKESIDQIKSPEQLNDYLRVTTPTVWIILIAVIILLAGMLMINVFPAIMGIGIGLFALTTLFSFITLPVEIDASRRAVAWLETAGITDRETTPMATSALRSAAYTYVVAALSSLATLVYYILIFIDRR